MKAQQGQMADQIKGIITEIIQYITSQIFSAMPTLRSGVLNTGWNAYIPFAGHKQHLRVELKKPHSMVLSRPTHWISPEDRMSLTSCPWASVMSAEFYSEASLKTEHSFGEMS